MMPSEHLVCAAYRASILHALGPQQPQQREEFSDGLLLVDAAGKVAACGEYARLHSQLPRDCPVHDCRPGWIVPGFVDCHVHLPQLDCRNKNGLTLLDWLKTYIYPAEAAFADPRFARQVAIRFFDTLLAHGITTAAVYSTVHYEATDIAFQVAHEKGFRVVMGQVLMDQQAPDNLLRPARQLLKESEQLIKKWHGKEGRLFFAVTPRFALTCSEPLLQGAGRLAKEAQVHFQTHLAETISEVEQARQLHSFKQYTDLYEKTGCLHRQSLFAHCIYLQERELETLAEYQCAVAHCPTSNVFLKSGTMPLAPMEKLNLRIGLGTDVGAGPTFSMREVIDCACRIHPKGTMSEAKGFYLATLGGAEALGFGRELGNFVAGKWADFSVFENASLHGFPRQVYLRGVRSLL